MIVSPSGANRAAEIVPARNVSWLNRGIGAVPRTRPLAIKPHTDDMREAPSLVLIDALRDAGATVTAHDPAAMAEARRMIGDGIRYAESNYQALEGADALVVVTDWNEYRHPDFGRIKATLRKPIVIDGRNLYDHEKMKSMGFTYDSVGRSL